MEGLLSMGPTKNVDVSDGIDGNVDDDADAFFVEL